MIASITFQRAPSYSGTANFFSLAFESYGTRILIGTNRPAILNSLVQHLPPGAAVVDPEKIASVFTVLFDSEDFKTDEYRQYRLYQDCSFVLATPSRDTLENELARLLHSTVALECPSSIFVHAGVVAWKDTAIVMPGRSMTGKSSLVMALVEAGATYFSDEYAVFDENGCVSAYPKPLNLRINGDGRLRKLSATDLGGCFDYSVPLRVSLVVATHYDERAKWAPKSLTPGETVLRLFDNTIDALRRTQHAISIFAKVAVSCHAIASARPSARSVAPLLLAIAERRSEMRVTTP